MQPEGSVGDDMEVSEMLSLLENDSDKDACLSRTRGRCSGDVFVGASCWAPHCTSGGGVSDSIEASKLLPTYRYT